MKITHSAKTEPDDDEGFEGPFHSEISEEDFQKCIEAAERGIVLRSVSIQEEVVGPPNLLKQVRIHLDEHRHSDQFKRALIGQERKGEELK